jgi:hypothetical protein
MHVLFYLHFGNGIEKLPYTRQVGFFHGVQDKGAGPGVHELNSFDILGPRLPEPGCLNADHTIELESNSTQTFRGASARFESCSLLADVRLWWWC